MSIPLDLTHIQSGFLTASAFNANAAKIIEAFGKSLNREGGAGNSMEDDLDMGLNKIINADYATTSYGVPNYQQVLDMVSGFLIRAKNILVTSYTLKFSDIGLLLRVDTEDDCTITIPKVVFTVGAIIHIRQIGQGKVTVVGADQTVELDAPQGENFTSGPGFGLSLVYLGQHKWDVIKSYTGVQLSEFDWTLEAVPLAEGSYRLPAGLSFRWGSTILTDSATAVVYDETFHNNTVNVQLTLGQDPSTSAYKLWAEDFSAQGFSIKQEGLLNTRVNWFSLGA